MQPFINKKSFFLILVLLAGIPAAMNAQHDDSRKAEHSAGHGANPLQEEMVMLDEVFREVVSGVALADGLRVSRVLEQMHGAMEKTHEAVHHGTVKVPKNADRIQEFINQDKQLHVKLEKLASAGKKNNQGAMLKLTQELLADCVRCHRIFRK